MARLQQVALMSRIQIAQYSVKLCVTVASIHFNINCSTSGVDKLFTRRAAFEKILKLSAALIGRAKKRSTRPQMSYFLLKIGEGRK